ncbi:MAG: 2'-deoxycytidine 5'-triphosphate deaminase [Patescibacteria group bacterium]
MILPRQSLLRLARGKNPIIHSTSSFLDGQFQPASLDLSLDGPIYCMRVSGLPRRGERVRDLIDRHARYHFELTLEENRVLEQKNWYLIRLAESFSLPPGYSAKFSPKSSTGRGGVFVRVIGDTSHYDFTEPGYEGPLFLEVYPYVWSIRVALGLCMTQARFKEHGGKPLVDREIVDLHCEHGILLSKTGKAIPVNQTVIRNGKIYLHLDLQRKIVGWRTKDSVVGELEMNRKEYHKIEDFFEPIPGPVDEIIVTPGHMYLFSTVERIRIPESHCGQLDERTTEAAEGRQHIAGFFDPFFGGEEGKHGVLEYIPDANFGPERLVHGQIMASMLFESLSERPDKVYGEEIGSHYIGGSEPQLPKYFKDWDTAWSE